MVRRNTSIRLTSVHQTMAKMILTLPDHRSTGPSDI
jgi:hypothetical protein